ncbi:DUF2293 domain-containing protein [Streptomyces tanashiensis]|uniref:DUF2293 domain-containing protein n=1 Tax=Streptomyces tanashiensis TaxID=67367 RepID=A0ABY6R3J4_9ACTN|nr:DUF2293 domain-containing protein [Streptomyces tanashiensis]UZX24572.1 DUF2293 domain-containing protein [Streptomyces tanashiensis]GGY14091.1 hypothetical protein GCM10010299_18570 [Streptomyces tanashiensis]
MDLVAPVVVEPLRRRRCSECHRGPLERMIVEFNAPVCLDCADLGHLVFLCRGDTALTRRAREASTLWAVVVRHNRRRTRYERQGLLVEEAALAEAERACLADGEARAARRARDAVRRAARDAEITEVLLAEILRLFPSCPVDRATEIAVHASAKGSGRVGRTAAGRSLDRGAVTAAVRASVRHVDTPYDSLLMRGIPRHQARTRVAPAIEAVLLTWRRGGGATSGRGHG